MESTGNTDIRTSLKKQDSCQKAALIKLKDYCSRSGKEDSILAIALYTEKNKPCVPSVSASEIKAAATAVQKLSGKVWIRKDGWPNSIFVDTKNKIHFIQYKNSQAIQVKDNLLILDNDTATIQLEGNNIRIRNLDGKSVTLRQAVQKDIAVGNWYSSSRNVSLVLYPGVLVLPPLLIRSM
jgi:maltodextrin utilization protein YvdJ